MVIQTNGQTVPEEGAYRDNMQGPNRQMVPLGGGVETKVDTGFRQKSLARGGWTQRWTKGSNEQKEKRY